ncbi:MAG TPA: hypothetical protein VFK24_06620 [Gammaproteobacteria bacterium]|nr:hypothetical protein [Gammaproteobacteria bacterium]
MVFDNSKTCILVLAYGDRCSNLSVVLNAVRTERPKLLVIVENEISDRSKLVVEEFMARGSLYTELVILPNNLGSAGGYAKGIKRALELPGWDTLWLLDDDNRPTDGSLHALEEAFQSLCDPHVALLASRPDLPEMVALIDGDAPPLPRLGSFIGFHIGNLFGNPITEGTLDDGLSMAPYGGLFISRELLSLIGLPNERYFLYCDDIEWTSRISKVGGKIMLARNAIVRDLDPVWNATGPTNSNLLRRIFYLDQAKAYYEIRNRLYTARTLFPGRRTVYRLNRFIYMSATALICIMFGKMKRWRLISKAVRDAESGLLGRIEDL